MLYKPGAQKNILVRVLVLMRDARGNSEIVLCRILIGFMRSGTSGVRMKNHASV